MSKSNPRTNNSAPVPYADYLSDFNSGQGFFSLALGMTAGFAVSGQPTSNTPFDPHIWGGNPNWSPQRVGVMRSSTQYGAQGGPFYLYFMFNPNQIVVSFQTNSNNLPPAYWLQSNANSNSMNPGTPTSGTASKLIPGMVGGQTVSWSLLFDRTYEMYYQTKDWDRGVLKDVAALYNILGAFVGGQASSGVPMSLPVDVIFGVTGSGAIWGFTGFVTSTQITYGIFRENMIPARCEIDLTMQANYIGSVPTTTPSNPPNVATQNTAQNRFRTTYRLGSGPQPVAPPLTSSGQPVGRGQ